MLGSHLIVSCCGRGRFFGSKLALKEEWVVVDTPFFDAPGALTTPLTPNDQLGLSATTTMPFISMVFCIVEGGKLFASKNRMDAQVP